MGVLDRIMFKGSSERQSRETQNEPIPAASAHFVNGHSLSPPFPDGVKQAVFGMGCFWGAEKKFWECPGVYVTAVGYAGGSVRNVTYQEVCTGETGHAEVVLVVFNPDQVSFDELLTIFWENHDPTQGMRQGNDFGTQYRSVVFTESAEQQQKAEASRALYQESLKTAGYSVITTEIHPAPTFYYAESYHQQYLAKNPAGYCGLGGTGVRCSVGADVQHVG